MKKLSKVNEFNVTINNEVYTVDIRETERKKSMPNCLIFECMSFTSEMVPYNRFKIVYDFHNKIYWAWTMDTVNENIRTFRENIAELLNNKILKLAA